MQTGGSIRVANVGAGEGPRLPICDETGAERIDFSELEVLIERVMLGFKIETGYGSFSASVPRLRYRGVDLVPENRRLGKGVYGTVFRYVVEAKGSEGSAALPQVVAKILMIPSDEEAETVKKLSRDAKLCSIVGAMKSPRNAVVEKHGEKSIVLMDSMSGDLAQLASQMDIIPVPLALAIMRELTEIAICLRKAGYAYTDYKTPNILYHCETVSDEGTVVTLAYGDLGSLVPYGTRMKVVTYPAPHAFKPDTEIHWSQHLVDERDITWGIVVTILSLYAHTTPTSMDLLKVKVAALQFVDSVSHRTRQEFITAMVRGKLIKFLKLSGLHEIPLLTMTVLDLFKQMFEGTIGLEQVREELEAA